MTDVRTAVDDPFVGAAQAVSIFLSPLDVHVNRSPLAGLVVGVEYRPGAKMAAYRAEASEQNERTSIAIQGEAARVVVRQIAGVLARRIVCRVRPGDKLASGRALRPDQVRVAHGPDRPGVGAASGEGGRSRPGGRDRDGGAPVRRRPSAAPAAALVGAARAAAADDLPPAGPSHDGEPPLRVLRDRADLRRPAPVGGAGALHRHGARHAGREGGAADADHHPVRRGVRLARRRRVVRGRARPSCSTRGRSSRSAAWARGRPAST